MLENMIIGTWTVNTIGFDSKGWYTELYTVNLPNRSVFVLAAISNTLLPTYSGVAVAIRRYTYMNSSGVNQTVELQDSLSNGAVIRPNSMRIDNATSVTFEVGMNGGGWAQAICMVISC